MNSEKVSPNKVFNRRKEEEQVHKIFRKENPNSEQQKSMVERIREVNEYFKKKGDKNE